MYLIQERAYTVSWLVQIKVTATSDLWLFIHASSLLPSLPTPLPYIRLEWDSGVDDVCFSLIRWHIILSKKPGVVQNIAFHIKPTAIY